MGHAEIKRWRWAWILFTVAMVAALLFMGSHWLASDRTAELTEGRLAQTSKQQTGLAADLVAAQDQILDRPKFDDLHRAAHNAPTYRDPYRGQTSLMAVMSELIHQGEIEPKYLANELFMWTAICRASPPSSDDGYIRLQVAGLGQDAVQQVDAFCSELAARDRESHADDELFRWDPLRQLKEREGQDAALRRALEIITYSRSEAEITVAVRFIILSEVLDSPFPDVSSSSLQTLWLGKVSVAAYSALLCDNLGGCLADHPLVVRYCLIPETRLNCHHPRDIYHAIEQSLTPIQHILFWSLLNQIDALRRRYL